MANIQTKFNTIKEKMDRVDEIIDQIQSDKISLEEKLELYKEGKALIKELDTNFKEARVEIDKIKE